MNGNTVRISRPPAGGAIDAIVSKSAAHRLLIAGFLTGLSLEGRCEGLSRDITATRECLLRMEQYRCASDGAPGESSLPVEGPGCGQSGSEGGCELPCGESGSTLRFLIPLAGALGIPGSFLCEGRLPDRPMDEFLDCLAAHGCAVTGRNPKILTGRLNGGDYVLPGNISSQYVTGLLFALPCLEEDSRIRIRGVLQSRPYVDMTLQVLRLAGISAEETRIPAGDAPAGDNMTPEAASSEETVISIRGGQRWQLPEAALDSIEGDWSNAAFWIVMDGMLRLKEMRTSGAVQSTEPADPPQRIFCRGLDPGSVQGDKAVVAITERILQAGDGDVDIDVSDIPDLVPALSALACARPDGSITRIVNAGRLRFKESDRLHAVTQVLNGLGADITEHEESLTIRSRGSLAGGSADAFGDHRIAMMAASAACICREPVTISGADAVNKSYPGFYEDLEKLGGEAEWL